MKLKPFLSTALLGLLLTNLHGCSTGSETDTGKMSMDVLAVAADGDIVSVHFTATTADGKVFETTRDGEARQVRIGSKLILPAFEQALIGMRPGERKTFTVQAKDAYGERIEDESMLQVMYRANQPHPLEIAVGQHLVANIEYPDGSRAQREVQIVRADEHTFTIDANHPLAGKDLNFDIELVGIAAGS